MAHLGFVGQVKEIGKHLLARQGGCRKRCDEFLCRRCQDGRYGPSGFPDLPDQVQRLESGDAASDDQQYAFAL